MSDARGEGFTVRVVASGMLRAGDHEFLVEHRDSKGLLYFPGYEPGHRSGGMLYFPKSDEWDELLPWRRGEWFQIHERVVAELRRYPELYRFTERSLTDPSFFDAWPEELARFRASYADVGTEPEPPSKAKSASGRSFLSIVFIVVSIGLILAMLVSKTQRQAKRREQIATAHRSPLSQMDEIWSWAHPEGKPMIGSLEQAARDTEDMDAQGLKCAGMSEGEKRSPNLTLNDVALSAYESGTPFEPGAVILKYMDLPNEPGAMLLGMKKREPGYDPAHNDWEYLSARSLKRIQTGTLSACIVCHSRVATEDFVFTRALE